MKTVITYKSHNDLRPAMNKIGYDNILPKGETLGTPNYEYETSTTFQFETATEIHVWNKPKRLLK